MVKLADDLMSATRYGIMSLRFAEIERALSEDAPPPAEPFDPFTW